MPIEGEPDPKHISTSYAERQNLNVRMHTRRFTRLTNAFSKKVENHAHAVALFALYYNFVRVHKTLRMTPAMAAGVTKRLWEMSEMQSCALLAESRIGSPSVSWFLVKVQVLPRKPIPGCRRCFERGRQHVSDAPSQGPNGPAWSKNLACAEAPWTGTGRSQVWPAAVRCSGPHREGEEP